MTSFLRSLFSVNSASLTLGTILVTAALFLVGVPILDLVELETFDLRFRSRGALEPSPAVVLAMVDEKSLDREGRWPWPRSRMAALVDRLSADGARVIAFDIGFLEPEVGTDSDLEFAEAIERSSADVVLGYFFHMSKEELAYEIDKAEIDQQLARIDGSKYPLVLYRDPQAKGAPLLRAYAPEGSVGILAEAADSTGYFSLRNDQDGVVRWMPLVIQGGEELFPPLGLLAAWHYTGEPQLMVRVGRYGIEGLQMGDLRIPTDESGELLINYPGPPKTFPHIPVADILAGETPTGTFRDKIVVVGATATGTYDTRSTPVGTVFPGAEIHAAVIDNILTGRFLTKPEWARTYDLAAIILLASLVGLAMPRLGPVGDLLVTGSLFTAHIVVARQLFVGYGVWLNVVYPLLALTANYTGLTIYSYVTEERERKKIRGAFDRYVSPVVIEEMLKEPGRLKLGGEEKVLTVLFSDLQGFTSYTERYGPQKMIELLSEYYARMTEQVFECQGMLKEYVGDELMAIFGAPVDQADHAERGCAAALKMRDQRQAMNVEWAAMGRPPLNARTGVNSGRMLVGNLGSEYRLSYGVLGDDVNLGSRLEGLNKAYGTQILIGQNTAELVKRSFLLREIDLVRVVGKDEPTRIYELLGAADLSLSSEQEKGHKTYAAALAAYRQLFWHDALALFKECSTLLPGDGPSQTMAVRCELYQDSPPPQNWDGVFEATSK